MIKLEESKEGGGPRKTISKHSSFLFSAESDREARTWVIAIRAYTLDDPRLPDDPVEAPAEAPAVASKDGARDVDTCSEASSSDAGRSKRSDSQAHTPRPRPRLFSPLAPRLPHQVPLPLAPL